MELKVNGRTIENLQGVIGLQNDSGLETIKFTLPRYYGETDLSRGLCYLLLKYPSGELGFVYLSKETAAETITATWLVGADATRETGVIQAQLKISGLENTLWHSEITRFTVARSLPVETPQPVQFRSARTAQPDNESPITIAERRIVIPPELQNISVQNDENSETVAIVAPRWFDGHDLDGYSAVMKTISSGGRDDLLLEKVGKTESELRFSWTLRPPQTSYSGALQLQIRFEGEEFKWETEAASVNIITSLDDAPVIPTTPSILDDFVQQVAALAGQAAASKDAAAASQAAAKVSETNSKASETAAAGSAADAEASNQAAKTAQAGAEKSAGEALASQNAAKTSEDNAKASETAAKLSETNAKASEVASKGSQDAAKDSVDKAKASETAAEVAQAAAETARDNAQAKAEAAEESAVKAKASEDAAKASETASKASETAAGKSAGESANSATEAAGSATAAAQSEANAAGSAGTATTKAGEADASAKLSKSYAVGGTGTRDGEDTDNARYYKEQAIISTAVAQDSAQTATEKATEAASSAESAARDAASIGEAAETATTKAEEAKASAETAKTEAEKAKAEADRAKDIVGGDYATRTELNTGLAGKVDAVDGKGLSSEDYTADEKTKLAGIEAGATNYQHPATHPASMITGLGDAATKNVGTAVGTVATGNHGHEIYVPFRLETEPPIVENYDVVGHGAHIFSSPLDVVLDDQYYLAYEQDGLLYEYLPRVCLNSEGDLYITNGGTFLLDADAIRNSTFRPAKIVKFAKVSKFIGIPPYLQVEGTGSVACSKDSHAEGYKTKATDTAAHAEGRETIASGDYSHAEGRETIASGNADHAEGEFTQASGSASHAEGYETIASSFSQHVQGEFNIEDAADTYAHIVGNGTADDARSNAHTLDWDGNGWYAGKLTVGAGPTESMDVATKGYVDAGMSGLGDAATKNIGTTAGTVAAGDHNHSGVYQPAGDYAALSSLTSKANTNLSNVTDETFKAKADAAGIGGGAVKEHNHNALGVGTTAVTEEQLVVGKYNTTNPEALFIVGQGTGETERSNAVEIKPSEIRIGEHGILSDSNLRLSHYDGYGENTEGVTIGAFNYNKTGVFWVGKYGFSGDVNPTNGDALPISSYNTTTKIMTLSQTRYAGAAGQTVKAIATRKNTSMPIRITYIPINVSSEYTTNQVQLVEPIYGSISSVSDWEFLCPIWDNSDTNQGLAVGNNNMCSGNGFAFGKRLMADDYQLVLGQWNRNVEGMTTPSGTGFAASGMFVIGNGKRTGRANVYRIDSAGSTYAGGSYHTSGADYAEMFEWWDGNPDGEDRRGRFVVLHEGKLLLYGDNPSSSRAGKVFPGSGSDEKDILGIVSAAPAILGDSYEDQWQGMYETDIFGEVLYEEYTDPAYTDEEGIFHKEEKRMVPKTNPEYDPEEPYVPRSRRKEWAAVGMMGKLVVIDDGTCTVGGRCVPREDGYDGIGTASATSTGYHVLERLDASHIRVLIK